MSSAILSALELATKGIDGATGIGGPLSELGHPFFTNFCLSAATDVDHDTERTGYRAMLKYKRVIHFMLADNN